VVLLVRVALHLMDAALASDHALAEALGYEVVPGWATFTDALKPSRDALASNPESAVWGPRLFIAGDPPQLVGWGGFKGPPVSRPSSAEGRSV
jgi:ribosomal-protein-alanine N-acetyltransferase